MSDTIDKVEVKEGYYETLYQANKNSAARLKVSNTGVRMDYLSSSVKKVFISV